MSKVAQIAAIVASALLGTTTAYTQTGASGVKSTGSGNTRYENSKLLQARRSPQDCNSMSGVRLDTGHV